MAEKINRQQLADYRQHLQRADRLRRRHADQPHAPWPRLLDFETDVFFDILDYALTQLNARPLPWNANDTLDKIVNLVSDAHLCRAPRASVFAARFAAKCPSKVKDKDTSARIEQVITQCIGQHGKAPSQEAIDHLYKAAARTDLSWGVRLLFATYTFPSNKTLLSERIKHTDFNSNTSPGRIQDWLLNFANDDGFLETWGELFIEATYPQRRFLLERAVTEGGADDVLRGLSRVRTLRVMGPGKAYAQFATAHRTPACGLFLAWYMQFGGGDGEMDVLTALSHYRGPHVENVLEFLAQNTTSPAMRDRVHAVQAGDLSGPPLDDPLSVAVSRLLEGAQDPGDIDFHERELLRRAWREATDPEIPASLNAAQQADLLALGDKLLDRLGGPTSPKDPVAWLHYIINTMASKTWAGRADAPRFLIRAWQQSQNPQISKRGLEALWETAENGGLKIDDFVARTLDPSTAIDPNTRWLLARLRLPFSTTAFLSQIKVGRLGKTPPIGLQRHIIAQPATDPSRAALVAVYEACTETQRRGLLMSLEPPIDPGYLPFIKAVTTQGTPQTAAAAVRALGRCGPWSSSSFLHDLRTRARHLEDVIDEAIDKLAERWTPEGDAGIGALALTADSGGELAIASDATPNTPARTDITLRIETDNAFDELTAPPRRVPVTVQLSWWILTSNRWNIVWLWLLALSESLVSDRPGDTRAWVLPGVVGGLGLLVNHWIADTRKRLKLWRHGRTTWAEETKRSSRRGHGRNASTTYSYTYEFVAEDGRTYRIEETDTERRPPSVGADIQVLYLPTEDGGAGLRMRVVFGPLRIDSQGTLRMRWGWLAWVGIALAPWYFAAHDAVRHLLGH